MGMKPGMKMMVMQRMAQQDQNQSRSEYGGDSRRRMIGYDRDHDAENRRMNGEGWEGNRMAYGMDEPESRRRRDGRGRYAEGEGWEGNRSYQRNEYDELKYGMEEDPPHMGGYEPEARRRRDSRGRYMMGGAEHDEGMHSQTWYPPYGAYGAMPPMGMHHPGNSYGDIYAHGTIYAPDAMNKPMMGGDMHQPVDEHTARHWVSKMEGGEKFKAEQAEQLRLAHCPNCDKWEFYVALNMMYSDYCEAFKKLGMDRVDAYVMMAKSFLEDKDAGPHKLRKYMETIPK